MGSFRFFAYLFDLHFFVFDIDNAYLVVKKLGSFCKIDGTTDFADCTDVSKKGIRRR